MGISQKQKYVVWQEYKKRREEIKIRYKKARKLFQDSPTLQVQAFDECHAEIAALLEEYLERIKRL